MTMDFKEYEKQIRANQTEKANDSNVSLGDIDSLVSKINRNYSVDVEIPKYDINSFNNRLKTYKKDLVSSDHKKSDNAVDEMHNMLAQLKQNAIVENNKAKAKQVKKAEKVVFKEEEKARKILAKEEARLKELAAKQEAELTKQKALAEEKIRQERANANAEIEKMQAEAKAKAELELKKAKEMKAKIEQEKAKMIEEIKTMEEASKAEIAAKQMQQPVYVQQPVQPIYIQQPFIQQQMQQNIATTTSHDNLIAELRKVVAQQKQANNIANPTAKVEQAPVEVKNIEVKRVEVQVAPKTEDNNEQLNALPQTAAINSIGQRRVVRMQDIERKGVSGIILIFLLSLIVIGIGVLIWIFYNRG